MTKSLSEMTLEELWQLFPIVLTPHRDCWNSWYEEERVSIQSILTDEDVRISHIGSTAIPEIWAKPTVDILVEISPQRGMEAAKQKLVLGGWGCMNTGRNRMSFQKGYTENGFADKVFHLHLHYYGDNDELYFRDYLCDHPELAKEYERLKLSLWKRYEHDRDAYTLAKGDFIAKYTAEAKEEYTSRWAQTD